MGFTRLVRKILATGFCRGVTAAGTFALNVLLAWRLPSIDEYGRFAVCLAAVVALAIFSRFGFDTSLLRFGGIAWHVGDFRAFRTASRTALLTVATISSSILVVGEIGLVLLAENWGSARTMQCLLPALPFLTISYVVGASFKAAHRPETGALFEIGGASLLACLVLLAAGASGLPLTAEVAAIWFTLSSAVFGLLGLLALVLVLWTKSNRPSEQRVEPLEFGRYLATSADFAVIAVAQVLANSGGLFFLEIWHDEATAGVFSAAMRTAMLPMLLLNVVVTICSPRIAGLYQQKDRAGLRQLTGGSAMVVFAINFPLLLCLCMGAPWVMRLFGPEFQLQWPLLSILAAGQLVGTLTGISAPALGMMGEQRLVRRIGLISALLAVMLSAALAAEFGALGAALASASYATCHACAVAAAAWRKLGFVPLPAFRPGRASMQVG